MNTKASIICELAFMTNQHEAMDLMANRSFWEECAKEIADGLDRYLNRNIYHMVTKGETLSIIAVKNNTTIKKLMKINKIKNPDKIEIGQKILLP
jgi:hypothetical protein